MQCTNCSAQTPEAAVFCQECGTAIAPRETADSVPPPDVTSVARHFSPLTNAPLYQEAKLETIVGGVGIGDDIDILDEIGECYRLRLADGTEGNY